jgi:hypothetical protein
LNLRRRHRRRKRARDVLLDERPAAIALTCGVDAPALPFCATHALVPPVFGIGLSVVSQSR